MPNNLIGRVRADALWRTVTVLCAALWLSACSSLQIDVDVYKGALIQQPEVQMRQYAALAMSARPLIERMRKTAAEERKRCVPSENGVDRTGCNLNAAEATFQFFDDIWGMYTGESKSLMLLQRKANRAKDRGLDVLTQELIDEISEPPSNSKDADVRKAASVRKAENVREAMSALNESLIFFAQKILYNVNNQALFKEFATGGGGILKTQIPVLQSLGNTILVHANDLQRQQSRDADLVARAPGERDAVQSAFRVAPSVSYDRIIGSLKDRALPTVAAPPAPAASAPPSKEAAALTLAEPKLQAARSDALSYRNGLFGLIAAYRTLVNEPGDLVPDESVGRADQSAADADRRQLESLYPTPALPEGERSEARLLGPLRQWLTNELGARAVPQRQVRLAAASSYIEAEKARLLSAMTQAGSLRDAFKALKGRLGADIGLAAKLLQDNKDRVDALAVEVQRLSKAVAELGVGQALALKAAQDSNQLKSETEMILAMLESVRTEVLTQADASRVTDDSGVHNLLKLKLAALRASADGSAPTQADLELSRKVVGELYLPPLAPCTDGCFGERQIDVVDGLIATLRVQRVQALARGDRSAAENLLLAINVAYEQRTAMVYLRPASDYLRSVYSASAFQDMTEPQYRNMLNEWLSYINPLDGRVGQGKEQVEKLHWQNINKVTVSGGGRINYVLAKDDVGNWYVKAYSSDPEAIIKSATSLALFNAGKGINTNLLRRYEMQRKVDDPNTSAEDKTRMTNEMADINSQDGVPLLKVRDRYKLRYVEAARHQVIALGGLLDGLPAKVLGEVGTPASTPAPSAECTAAQGGVTTALAALATARLDPARTTLHNLSDAAPADGDDKQALRETAISNALSTLHLYAGEVHKILNDSKLTACDAWPRNAADRARKYIRTQLVTEATAWRGQIERFEDALNSIAAIAAEH